VHAVLVLTRYQGASAGPLTASIYVMIYYKERTAENRFNKIIRSDLRSMQDIPSDVDISQFSKDFIGSGKLFISLG
jgi:hypothetical protein